MRFVPSASFVCVLLSGCARTDDLFGQGGQNDLGVPSGDAGGDGGDGGGDEGAGDGGTGDGGSDTGTVDGGAGDGGTVVELQGTGYGVGDVAYDLVGTDQAGGAFRLHGLYGQEVVLVVGHMDDPAFSIMTGWLGELTGANVVALVGRDESSVAADSVDALGWASDWGVGTVLVDPSGKLVNTWAERAPPKVYVIDAEMVIAWVQFGAAEQGDVQAAIDGE